MRRISEPAKCAGTGGRPLGTLRPGLLGWGVSAACCLAVAWWGWGQSNVLSKAVQPAGARVHLGALHPQQHEELKGRPLCVYNFTTW